ncbi:hypothetical protein GobsT_50780 [Gemmata obscuriglobus]|uniref:hypothetical protein n=1 Tax=Gemmata obscuriglobus TaxID=114 RepID=UPI00016C4D5F|nr:hypothetical protein [Gemmata obscuriglobus]QEG30274.1 hypothetical protein GobsT_50780 [Gemmata obscuriglobus]VTS09598.1 unnamed protein product [Gemmata obscuriglobus UQM 2246]
MAWAKKLLARYNRNGYMSGGTDPGPISSARQLYREHIYALPPGTLPGTIRAFCREEPV